MEDEVDEKVQNVLLNHSLNCPLLLQIQLILNAFGLCFSDQLFYLLGMGSLCAPFLKHYAILVDHSVSSTLVIMESVHYFLQEMLFQPTKEFNFPVFLNSKLMAVITQSGLERLLCSLLIGVCSFKPEFLSLGIINILSWIMQWGAVLCHIGCVAAPLGFTHQMPVEPAPKS